jgi:hypothetical protein
MNISGFSRTVFALVMTNTDLPIVYFGKLPYIFFNYRMYLTYTYSVSIEGTICQIDSHEPAEVLRETEASVAANGIRRLWLFECDGDAMPHLELRALDLSDSIGGTLQEGVTESGYRCTTGFGGDFHESSIRRVATDLRDGLPTGGLIVTDTHDGPTRCVQHLAVWSMKGFSHICVMFLHEIVNELADWPHVEILGVSIF